MSVAGNMDLQKCASASLLPHLQALTWLLTVPGASNTVLESRVPYGGGKSMSDILGREPQKFASTQTAVDMAKSAYKQAAHLSSFGAAILGVSCTCALATDRIKKGDHKVIARSLESHKPCYMSCSGMSLSLSLTGAHGSKDDLEVLELQSRVSIISFDEYPLQRNVSCHRFLSVIFTPLPCRCVLRRMMVLQHKPTACGSQKVHEIGCRRTP